VRVLGIETSCDESAAAVAEDGVRLLSNVVASQVDLHARFGGVVPELASRAHLETINGCVEEALERAGVSWTDLDGIAVTNRPGLIGSLLVGLCAAKTYALCSGLSLVGVHHIEGHIAASFLLPDPPSFPFLALVASGGHTELILVHDHGRPEPIGSTRDDAAGEAFDKVARLLGLEQPGGPAIDRLAAQCDDGAERFPRAHLGDSLDFSYSGLKTAVARRIEALGPGIDDAARARIAHGFQMAAVEPLVMNAVRAAERHGVRHITIGGGVAANGLLRSWLAAEAESRGLRVHLPPPALCTDNAGMIAVAGCFALARGRRDGLDLDAYASAPLPVW